MLIGKRISGRYKILDLIGGGGMANVYLAHDMILDREVAIKMLRLDFANEDEFIKRFQREAQSATSLAHPNIVSIYDVGEESDLYYIVMEYVDGMTLKQYIQQHSPISVETALDILTQLTAAISHAHQNNIVHRDIKPQNILIDSLGNVKITDFGIAMALSATSITQTNSVLGSVHYLSPEQARGGMANKKSDIYSLGIVMFELLTGRLPFSGETAVSIALKHLQSETPSVRRWNSEVPQSVENIVLKSTAKDPFRRYDTVEEMEEDLKTALDYDRLDEPKFSIPLDDDATKAIPVITDDRPLSNMEDTIVHQQSQQNIEPKPKKRKKWPIIVIISFFLLSAAGILAITVLPNLLGPEEVEVPDVMGKEVEEAIKELTEAGFEIGDRIEQHHDEVPLGQVYKTDPSAGRNINEGDVVNLYVSLGKPTEEIANYIGRQFDVVKSELEGKGFTVNEGNSIFSEEPPGTILDQNVDPGEQLVPEETTITFTTSRGKETFELADLKGYSEKPLEDYQKRVGLVINRIEEYSEEVPKGNVISQSPKAGTMLSDGDTVDVVVSKGPEPKPDPVPKTVPVEIIIPYEPNTEMESQQIFLYVRDMNNDINQVYKEYNIAETTSETIELLIAPNGNAEYKLQRDGNVIDQQTIPYPEDEETQ